MFNNTVEPSFALKVKMFLKFTVPNIVVPCDSNAENDTALQCSPYSSDLKNTEIKFTWNPSRKSLVRNKIIIL